MLLPIYLFGLIVLIKLHFFFVFKLPNDNNFKKYHTQNIIIIYFKDWHLPFASHN